MATRKAKDVIIDDENCLDLSKHSNSLRGSHLTLRTIPAYITDEKYIYLQKLDISGNSLTEVQNLDKLCNLQHLNLARNKIKVLSGIWTLNNCLKYLDISGNFIKRIPETIGCLFSLEVLIISGNDMNTLTDIERLVPLKKMIKLNSNANPFYKLPHYKDYIINLLRNLKYHDDILITEEQKNLSISRFQKLSPNKEIEEIETQSKKMQGLLATKVVYEQEKSDQLASKLAATSQLLQRSTAEFTQNQEIIFALQQELAFMKIDGLQKIKNDGQKNESPVTLNWNIEEYNNHDYTSRIGDKRKSSSINVITQESNEDNNRDEMITQQSNLKLMLESCISKRNKIEETLKQSSYVSSFKNSGNYKECILEIYHSNLLRREEEATELKSRAEFLNQECSELQKTILDNSKSFSKHTNLKIENKSNINDLVNMLAKSRAEYALASSRLEFVNNEINNIEANILTVVETNHKKDVLSVIEEESNRITSFEKYNSESNEEYSLRLYSLLRDLQNAEADIEDHIEINKASLDILNQRRDLINTLPKEKEINTAPVIMESKIIIEKESSITETIPQTPLLKKLEIENFNYENEKDTEEIIYQWRKERFKVEEQLRLLRQERYNRNLLLNEHLENDNNNSIENIMSLVGCNLKERNKRNEDKKIKFTNSSRNEIIGKEKKEEIADRKELVAKIANSKESEEKLAISNQINKVVYEKENWQIIPPFTIESKKNNKVKRKHIRNKVEKSIEIKSVTSIIKLEKDLLKVSNESAPELKLNKSNDKKNKIIKKNPRNKKDELKMTKLYIQISRNRSSLKKSAKEYHPPPPLTIEVPKVKNFDTKTNITSTATKNKLIFFEERDGQTNFNLQKQAIDHNEHHHHHHHFLAEDYWLGEDILFHEAEINKKEVDEIEKIEESAILSTITSPLPPPLPVQSPPRLLNIEAKEKLLVEKKHIHSDRAEKPKITSPSITRESLKGKIIRSKSCQLLMKPAKTSNDNGIKQELERVMMEKYDGNLDSSIIEKDDSFEMFTTNASDFSSSLQISPITINEKSLIKNQDSSIMSINSEKLKLELSNNNILIRKGKNEVKNDETQEFRNVSTMKTMTTDNLGKKRKFNIISPQLDKKMPDLSIFRATQTRRIVHGEALPSSQQRYLALNTNIDNAIKERIMKENQFLS